MRLRYIITVFLLIFLLASSIAIAQTITREEAAEAIIQAEQDALEMQEAGFSTLYVSDMIFAARDAIDRADFAELLRQNSSGKTAELAKKALEGLNYEGFTYNATLTYTEKVTERKAQAFEFHDSIRALEIQAEGYALDGINVSTAIALLEGAKDFFEKEQYNEVEALLADASSELENQRAELTTLNLLVASGKGFAAEHWLELIIFAIALLFINSLALKYMRIRKLKNQLEEREIEQESLLELMKRIQHARFREGKLPESIYTLRMEKYKNRMNEVKREIPVLRKLLKKVKKKHISLKYMFVPEEGEKELDISISSLFSKEKKKAVKAAKKSKKSK